MIGSGAAAAATTSAASAAPMSFTPGARPTLSTAAAAATACTATATPMRSTAVPAKTCASGADEDAAADCERRDRAVARALGRRRARAGQPPRGRASGGAYRWWIASAFPSGSAKNAW
jgi:hypothetical protein